MEMTSRLATGRLIDAGGFAKKDRITHRISVTSPAEPDDELSGWLRFADDRDVSFTTRENNTSCCAAFWQ